MKQIVTQPLDQFLSEQQHIDIAKHELNQLLEPLQSGAGGVPESAASVHQLLQQGVNQTEELNRLKVNVMGAFKHLVTQWTNCSNFNRYRSTGRIRARRSMDAAPVNVSESTVSLKAS